MREIVFDTETTGLDNQADRIIEIGAVELDDRFVTGRSFHVYINPDGRPVHPDALEVHGIDDAMLADKPRFTEVVEDWIAFSEGAKLVAHNASFDVAFFNAEFARIGFPPIDNHRVVDSLALARRRHPMGPNSLDALCQRYGIDNSRRTKHGALLDSELLAEVYVELVGGKQAALRLDTSSSGDDDIGAGSDTATARVKPRPAPLPARLSEAEIAAHEKLIAKLGEGALWRTRR